MQRNFGRKTETYEHIQFVAFRYCRQTYDNDKFLFTCNVAFYYTCPPSLSVTPPPQLRNPLPLAPPPPPPRPPHARVSPGPVPPLLRGAAAVFVVVLISPSLNVRSFARCVCSVSFVLWIKLLCFYFFLPFIVSVIMHIHNYSSLSLVIFTIIITAVVAIIIIMNIYSPFCHFPFY